MSRNIKIDRISLNVSQGIFDAATQLALWKERSEARRKQKKDEAEKQKKKPKSLR